MPRLPHFEVGNKADLAQSTFGLITAAASGLLFEESVGQSEPVKAAISASVGLAAMTLTFLSEQRREILKHSIE